MNQLRVAAAALMAMSPIFLGTSSVQAKDAMVIFHPPSPSELSAMQLLVHKDEFLNDIINHGLLPDLDKELLVASINLCDGKKATLVIVSSIAECGSAGCSVLGFQDGKEILNAGPVNEGTQSSNLTILDRTHLGCHDIWIDDENDAMSDHVSPVEIWTWRGKEYKYDWRESQALARKSHRLPAKDN